MAHVLTDLAGNFLSVDDRYCEILGRDRHELIGRGAVQFTNPVEQARHLAAVDQLRKSGMPITISKSYVRSDGKLMRVQNEASVITDGLGPSRLVATIRQIADTSPISMLEHDFSIVTQILHARRGRTDAFDAERFAGNKWDLALACFKLECVSPRLEIDDLCREIGIDPAYGMLDVLEMVARGDLEIEHAGSGLDDSSVRTSPALQVELRRYLAQFDTPPRGCV